VIRGALGGLARWPVKSMAGERLRAARLDGRGLGGDRTHALLEAGDGGALTAARAPRLLAWAAAYPDAPDDALDPAAPPLPRVRTPDGTVWGWTTRAWRPPSGSTWACRSGRGATPPASRTWSARCW
jgi:hypothetical protein